MVVDAIVVVALPDHRTQLATIAVASAQEPVAGAPSTLARANHLADAIGMVVKPHRYPGFVATSVASTQDRAVSRVRQVALASRTIPSLRPDPSPPDYPLTDPEDLMKRVLIVTITAVLASLVGWTPAEAGTCPSASVGGRTVAVMTVSGKAVPIKNVTFRNGGALDPPATNQAAGISTRNAPLNAKRGATVITWHVRYGSGCNGSLNSLITLPIGSTFTAGGVGKTSQTYQISSRVTVPKGQLQKSWFRKDGPHRLVLLTCADLRGGAFRKTMAIIATPVPAQPTAVQTAPA